MGCVDGPPAGLGGFDQFEDHGQPSGPAAGAAGVLRPQPHGSECRLDGARALSQRSCWCTLPASANASSPSSTASTPWPWSSCGAPTGLTALPRSRSGNGGTGSVKNPTECESSATACPAVGAFTTVMQRCCLAANGSTSVRWHTTRRPGQEVERRGGAMLRPPSSRSPRRWPRWGDSSLSSAADEFGLKTVDEGLEAELDRSVPGLQAGSRAARGSRCRAVGGVGRVRAGVRGAAARIRCRCRRGRPTGG